MTGSTPLAVVFGCGGPVLTDAERQFFADADPYGFILFSRNCETPEQVRRLVADLRGSVGRADADILIDQEGGRVARLRPPHWRAAPSPARFGELALQDREAAVEAARLNARLMAAELIDLGITVNCTPLLDVPQADADFVIGDRAFAATPEIVSLLGQAVCEGFLEGGVLPVVKHIPGHGRARADSHKSLPIVDASLQELEEIDFVPFRVLKTMPWGMTAHVLYRALDANSPATISRTIIFRTIRRNIGFEGVSISDDLSMEALSGRLRERAEAALAAGCDLALHCNGDMTEMCDLASGCRPIDRNGQRRLAHASKRRLEASGFDADEAESRLLDVDGKRRPLMVETVLLTLSTWVLPVLLAVTLHEAAHGFVAWRLGDDTAYQMGRVTFNPLRHIDPFGTVLLPVMMLLASGGQMMFGFAEPVPVNFHRLRSPRRDMIIVAAAGPATNLIMATAAASLFHVLPIFSGMMRGWIQLNLEAAVLINLLLCVFNMLPMPPLDGGRIAVGILPRALAAPLARLERVGVLIILGGVFLLPWLGSKVGWDLDVFWWLVGQPAIVLQKTVYSLTGVL